MGIAVRLDDHIGCDRPNRFNDMKQIDYETVAMLLLMAIQFDPPKLCFQIRVCKQPGRLAKRNLLPGLNDNPFL